MTTEPLSYGYTWQFPDYTSSSNTLYTIPSDGIVGPTDMNGQSLIATPSMSQLPAVEKTYESSQTRASSWFGYPYLQDTLGMDLLALQSQQSLRNLSRSPSPHRCFDHGCNGRSFSSRSNLRRHQRERARLTRILPCPLCGAKFYRRWTRNQHVLRASCLQRMSSHSRYPDFDQDSQSEQYKQSHGRINASLVPDYSACLASVSPSPVASAPVSQISGSQSAPSNNVDHSWQALS